MAVRAKGSMHMWALQLEHYSLAALEQRRAGSYLDRKKREVLGCDGDGDGYTMVYITAILNKLGLQIC